MTSFWPCLVKSLRFSLSWLSNLLLLVLPPAPPRQDCGRNCEIMLLGAIPVIHYFPGAMGCDTCMPPLSLLPT